MSETPATDQKKPDPGAEGDPKSPTAAHKGLRPELRDRLRQRKPIRDYGTLVMIGAICFLAFMFTYFVYTSYISSRPRLTIPVSPKPELYPVDRLLSATDVKLLSEDGGRADITYAFAEVAPNRTQLDKVLKDWRGPRNSLERIRVVLRDHEPIQLDAGTGIPLTPLLSVVSFDGDLDYTIRFEATQKVRLWFFFHYIYDYEVTGTALVVDADGTAQFVRYRRELDFDDPRGEPGRFEVKTDGQQSLRIVVKEFPLRAGYRCVAYEGEREVTRADFAPEWGEDRRYHPADTSQRLVAEFPQPPQAGFLAVVSDPTRTVRLHEIRVVGRVADAWREERTEKMMILEDLLKPPEAKDQPAEPEAPDPAPKPEEPGKPRDAASEPGVSEAP